MSHHVLNIWKKKLNSVIANIHIKYNSTLKKAVSHQSFFHIWLVKIVELDWIAFFSSTNTWAPCQIITITSDDSGDAKLKDCQQNASSCPTRCKM